MWYYFFIILILQMLTPYWWWIMVIPAGYGLWKARSGWRAFAVGASSAGLVWLLGSLFFGMTLAGRILPRVVALTRLPGPGTLYALTAGLAFLCGGFAAASGYWAKKIATRDPLDIELPEE
ncbi:MAG: hypothetical protein D6681_16185 [Calditrichaeota bacterium]|nr:MAG: hypothetical protein D6681_16185 [Calditrichota bacterium]